MSAYLIVDTQIENPVEYEEYKKLARPIAEKFGGIYRARGGALEICETDNWTPTRIVIVEFPDMVSAKSFVNSSDYEPVKRLRRNNAKCTMAIVEGV